MITKIFNIGSHRHYDENGYLYVDKSPVLKSGILEYLGSEIMDANGFVDGVKVEPQKLYKVYLPMEELEKAKDTFNLKPIVDDHKWLGSDGADAKNYQEGTTGEHSYIEDGMLYIPLVFTGKEIIKDIENGKEELSASYTNILEKSNNPEYDFIARDYKGNHIALVDRGRCGEKVRVLNSQNNNQKNKEQFIMKSKNEEKRDDSIVCNEDKRKLIDEVGGILKDKVDDETIRTIIGKMEKIAYDPSETSKEDNKKAKNEDPEDDKKVVKDEEPEDNKKEEKKAENSDVIYTKIANKLASEAKAKEEKLKKAYNDASSILGEFNPFGMSARDMYIKALNHAGVKVENESDEQLEAMLKVCNLSATKVDNSFSYTSAGKDEIEVNF